MTPDRDDIVSWSLFLPLCPCRCLPCYNDCWSLLNTLRLRQNGRHLPNDIFKCIFLNGNVYISIVISLKFVSKDPINNIQSLVQIMALAPRFEGHRGHQHIQLISIFVSISLERKCWYIRLSLISWFTSTLVWINVYDQYRWCHDMLTVT